MHIVQMQFAAAADRRLVGAARVDDHRNAGPLRIGRQHLADGQPVARRQIHVHDDQVGEDLVDAQQRMQGVGRFERADADLLEPHRQHVRHVEIVVGDQHGFLGGAAGRVRRAVGRERLRRNAPAGSDDRGCGAVGIDGAGPHHAENAVGTPAGRPGGGRATVAAASRPPADQQPEQDDAGQRRHNGRRQGKQREGIVPVEHLNSSGCRSSPPTRWPPGASSLDRAC